MDRFVLSARATQFYAILSCRRSRMVEASRRCEATYVDTDKLTRVGQIAGVFTVRESAVEVSIGRPHESNNDAGKATYGRFAAFLARNQLCGLASDRIFVEQFCDS